MATAEEMVAGVEEIRRAVKAVAAGWEPGNLARIDDSCLLLEKSLPRLRAALGTIPVNGSFRGVELKNAAAAMKQEAAAVAFLVDAAAGFLRSASGAQAECIAYTADGCTDAVRGAETGAGEGYTA